MSVPLKVAVLSCTAFSTGELALALECLRRCTRPLDLHAVVGTPMAAQARQAGATPHTYPAFGQMVAARAMAEHLLRLRADVVVLADLPHFYGVLGEFGAKLAPLMDGLLQLGRVVGMDVYDYDAHAAHLDVFGRVAAKAPPAVPAVVGRLMPSPYLRPQRSTPGRGRYGLMDAGAVASARQRQAAREHFHLDGPVALLTTSPWQHLCVGHHESHKVALHFPTLLLRLLDQAARRLGSLTLVHLGPTPLGVPGDANRLVYRHVPQMPAVEFQRLLDATDLVVSPNVIASSAIRAASRQIPVLTVHLGRAVEQAPELRAGASAAERAVHAFLVDAAPTYATAVWPLGFSALMERVLADNPFRGTSRHVDALDANALIDYVVQLLQDASALDTLQHAQAHFFSQLAGAVDAPDVALTRALEAA